MRSPAGLPDGKYLVFVRAGEKDDAGKPKPSQLALLSLTGGEARTITDLPKGASGAVWSPDSKRIAFVSDTTPEDIQKAERKKKADSNAESEHESDVHVISRAIYRDNDEGYLDLKRHSHIWVLDLGDAGQEPGKPVQITSGNYDEGDLVWSKDGSAYLFPHPARRRALLRTSRHRYLFGPFRRRRLGEARYDSDVCW